MNPRSAIAGLLLTLLPSAALAAGTTIEKGIDVFTTYADGRTFYDFQQNPIPAGFFCKRSQPFTGRVTFQGLPLATGAPGQLRNADTVIQRLDDATFDAQGQARTRIQFKALSLVSSAPLHTACGDFHVYVSLGGKQRITPMSIRWNKDNGGDFLAPLAVNARLTFVPVKPSRSKAAPKLELAGSFTFPARPLPWAFASPSEPTRIGAALVDTNGDLTPDTQFSGTTNFAPGRSPSNLKWIQNQTNCCPICHDSGTSKAHCYAEPGCQYIACTETLF